MIQHAAFQGARARSRWKQADAGGQPDAGPDPHSAMGAQLLLPSLATFEIKLAGLVRSQVRPGRHHEERKLLILPCSTALALH